MADTKETKPTEKPVTESTHAARYRVVHDVIGTGYGRDPDTGERKLLQDALVQGDETDLAGLSPDQVKRLLDIGAVEWIG